LVFGRNFMQQILRIFYRKKLLFEIDVRPKILAENYFRN
jgi:hypothetical protein